MRYLPLAVVSAAVLGAAPSASQPGRTVDAIGGRVDSKIALGHEGGKSQTHAEAIQLFNGRDLDGWYRYLGVAEVPSIPLDPFGRWPAPIGRDRDPQGVFSVVDEDGAPAIRISGEVWGALTTTEDFENYHLRLEYKWGLLRFAPREDAARNSGVLYHCVGPDGAFWSYWRRSAEFEIMEGRTGDFTAVDGIEATATSEWDRSAGYPFVRFAETGSRRDLGGLRFRLAATRDAEKPTGQWNQLEVTVRGDAASHYVNGERVLAVEHLQHDVDGLLQPLTKGAIQLQSEGAEIFFRAIELQPLDDREPAELREEIR